MAEKETFVAKLKQPYGYTIDLSGVSIFEEGLGFDNSSTRGWLSYMPAIPDIARTLMNPFFKEPTVSIIANTEDSGSKERYSRYPRYAFKTTAYLKKSGIVDSAYVGSETEKMLLKTTRQLFDFYSYPPL